MKIKYLISIISILLLFPGLHSLGFEISGSTKPFFIPGQKGEIQDINVTNNGTYPLRVMAIHSIFYWKTGRVQIDEFVDYIRIDPGKSVIVGKIGFEVPPREKEGYYPYELGITYEELVGTQWTQCTGLLFTTATDCQDRGKRMDPSSNVIRVLTEIPPEPAGILEDDLSGVNSSDLQTGDFLPGYSENPEIIPGGNPGGENQEPREEPLGSETEPMAPELELPDSLDRTEDDILENLEEKIKGICGPTVVLLFSLVVIGARKPVIRK